MRRLSSHTMSAGFRTVSLRGDAVRMGHVLNVDHFHMALPTFPPHPHAGFSAVTWMVPWSTGAFVNRDSLGDRSRIGPGDLHWTLAGAGMLHEEIPERPGVDCEGLQIFVKLPVADELTAPRAIHVDATDVPVWRSGGGVARVLVGALDDVRAVTPSHAGTTLAHLRVDGACSLSVPEGRDAFALVLRGAGRIAGAPAEAHDATPLAAGTVAVDGALDLLVGWSGPMVAQPRFQGPFCMFAPERLHDAVRRFHAGAMGALQPSTTGWAGR